MQSLPENRLESELHAHGQASPRHGVPGLGATLPDDIGAVCPQLIEKVIHFKVEGRLLVRRVIQGQIEDSVFIGRPSFRHFDISCISDEVEAIQCSTEFVFAVLMPNVALSFGA